MKNFTLIFLLGITLHFSGLSQERFPFGPGDQSAKILKFYPNPATTFIHFDFQKDYNRTFTLRIYNFLGKKVFELNNISPSNQVNLSDFTRGIFIFQLLDKDGRVIESGKFQVSK